MICEPFVLGFLCWKLRIPNFICVNLTWSFMMFLVPNFQAFLFWLLPKCMVQSVFFFQLRRTILQEVPWSSYAIFLVCHWSQFHLTGLYLAKMMTWHQLTSKASSYMNSCKGITTSNWGVVHIQRISSLQTMRLAWYVSWSQWCWCAIRWRWKPQRVGCKCAAAHKIVPEHGSFEVLFWIESVRFSCRECNQLTRTYTF